MATYEELRVRLIAAGNNLIEKLVVELEKADPQSPEVDRLKALISQMYESINMLTDMDSMEKQRQRAPRP